MKCGWIFAKTMSLLFFTVTAFAAQPLTVGATNRASWWMPRHLALVQKAKTERIEIYFLGDSITEQWGQQGSKVWSQSFAPLFAGNFGIGGDGIAQVLWRIQHGEMDGLSPKVLVLMIGTNNLWSHSAKEITDGHLALIREIQKRLPKTKILLLGVLPRLDAGSAGFRGKIGPINTSLAQRADGKTVFYQDLNEHFTAGTILADGVHLSERGYKVWAEKMIPVLKILLLL